jgi:hypothetical protein
MDSVVGVLRDVLERLQESNRRLAGVEMRGKIPENGIDAAKKKIRVVLGKTPEGEDVLSPWVPVKQVAGALKLHSLPSVGQVMSIRSETGDIEQGVAEPFHWSDDNPAPSDDPEEHLLQFGDVTVSLKSGGLRVSVGGCVWDFTSSGFDQTGGSIQHDGVPIDKTHVHKDVTFGPDLSGPPNK